LPRRFERSPGLERQADPRAQPANLVEEGTRVAELDVHRDAVGAGIGEELQQDRGVVDHEVTIEKEIGALAQRLHHRRANREVRHIVAVHTVDVQQIGFGRDARDVGREVGEIGGKNRRRDLHDPTLRRMR
jgi:hypothetical protein